MKTQTRRVIDIVTIRKSMIYFMIFLTVIIYRTANIDAQEKNVAENEKIFTLGILKNSFINVSQNDATVAINVWANKLRKKLNIAAKFKLMVFDNTKDMINYNTKNNLGMVLLNSINFLRLHDKMSLYPIFISSNSKSIYTKLLLITKKTNAENISGFKGKKLGFYLRESNPIPKLWMDVVLAKNKLCSEEKFFSRLKEYNSDPQVLFSVFFGQTDIGIVSEAAYETMNELNPQIGKQLKILLTSPGFVFDVASFTQTSRNNSYSRKIKKNAVLLNSSPEGKELMTLMKTERSVTFKPEYLMSTKKLFNAYLLINK